ncbi:MAG: ATP-binding protein [Alistipes sp.]
MENKELLQEILVDAKIGWWKIDTKRNIFILSDLLKKSINLTDNEITIDRFIQLAGSQFRKSLQEELTTYINCFVRERTFSLIGGDKETFFRWKVLKRETTIEGGIIMGYAQQVTPAGEYDSEVASLKRADSLLYQLQSVSHTLLSFVHTNTLDETINKVLSDILTMFQGSRAYIVAFDTNNRLHSCLYEVMNNGVKSVRAQIDTLSMDRTPWFIDHLMQGLPVILSDLDNLPPEAINEQKILSSQQIKSTLIVPLTSRNKIWGYAGIDIVNKERNWTDENYQWFASLIRIVNIYLELQHSEQEAQDERDYLQNLYRYMPLGYIRLKMLCDQTGTPTNYQVIDTNYAADTILGKTQSEYIGKTAKELGMDVSEPLSIMAQTLRAGHYVEKDSYLQIVNKYLHTVMYSTCPDEIICLLTDTSEMHATHEALNRSEKLLRNIYNNIPVGIELYDKDGQMVDVNNKDMDIFGVYDKKTISEFNFFTHTVTSPEIIERVRRHEEFSFKFDYQFAKHTGYESVKKGSVEIYTTVCMLYNTKGELINFMLINIDNTEINRAHTRIAEFEKSFLLVSRFGQVGYCRFDMNTMEGYAMPQWYINLGEQKDTPMSQVVGIYSHVDDVGRLQIMDALRRIKAGEIESQTLDLRIHVNNEEHWTRTNFIRNTTDDDSTKIELASVNYDITELKQTEQNLINAKNKAEESDRLKSAFLANMSHEIRTPLNAIVGFSDLLTESEDLQERREFMKIVKDNSDLLIKLISDILDLSKIEAGTLDFQNSEFDVNQMCQEIICSQSIKVGCRPIELRFGNHVPQCILLNDKNRLMQVLTNLLNNALKFTREGHITLSYQRGDDEMLMFCVEDTGSGIPENELAQVFGRFVKLNTFAQGTGLGLAICKSIVEQLGGEIGVNSQEGKGSCFWFTIPYTLIPEKQIPCIAKADSKQLDPTIKRPVILIAEYTDSHFTQIASILGNCYEVHRACTGQEAVELYHQIKPDLILMALIMPKLNGVEALRLIRAENSTLPIIAITSFFSDSDYQRALTEGFDDFLTKPVEGELLLQKLGKLLKR